MIKKVMEDYKVLLRSIPAATVSLFIVSVIMMNLLANKELISLPYLALDCGFVVSWVSFLCQDMICKRFGAKASIKISILALAVNLAVSLCFWLCSLTPGMWGAYYDTGMIEVNTALNATIGGTIIPLLTLGIPGDTNTAVLLGALTMQGIAAGPQLFTQHGEWVYTIMLGLIVVNVFMYILGSGFTRFYAHITRIPYEILAAIVLTFCIAGAYSTNNRMYDIYIILIFGIVAYFLRRMDFQLVPILLGIVLGPLAEKNFRRALVLSDGSLDIFFTRPISCAFILIAVGSILLFAWKNHKAKVKTTQK